MFSHPMSSTVTGKHVLGIESEHPGIEVDLAEAYQALLAVTRNIETEWRRFDHNVVFFPDIVYDQTHALDLSLFGELAHLPLLLKDPYLASIQHASLFSDLYFRLFDNGRFWVEILNWWGSDINIHDHDFSGVQYQLKGDSLNVIYRFSEADSNTNLTVGDISVASADIWQPGSRSFVRPGTVEPHNVNHLSLPTVSLLIRTHPQPMYGPQHNYLPPFLRGNYGVANLVFKKKISMLRLLARPGQPTALFHQTFQRITREQTATENLFLMTKMVDILFQEEHVCLLADFAQEGGPLEETIVQCMAFYKAYDVLGNTLKWTPGLSQDTILAVSVLVSAFNAETLETILASLAQKGYVVNMQKALRELEAHILPEQRTPFRNILALFELTSLVLEPA